ncbi:MAG: rod shape-determining protein MreD [Clostridiaceae bacterium]|nr:rod shape-determining protein MreD [Clostridiaceae bacterium]
MRVKIISYSILIFIMALLQSTVFNYIKIFDVKPNLLLILIVTVALLTNDIEGAAIGFFSGLVQDMASGKVLGFYALLGMYLGFSIGAMNKRLNRENILILLFFTFVSSIIYEYFVYLLNSIVRGTVDLIYPFRHLILTEALYNCGVSVLIFAVVLKLNRWFVSMDKTLRKY